LPRSNRLTVEFPNENSTGRNIHSWILGIAEEPTTIATITEDLTTEEPTVTATATADPTNEKPTSVATITEELIIEEPTTEIPV
ncbi:unnamed protein product, partial [Cercopithifilaria johnstoni]